MFGSWKLVPGKLLSKLSCVCLSLEKLVNEKHFSVNRKHFPSKENLAWFSGKRFPFTFGRKHFLEVVKNLEMSLFADYFKFDPQTFDCYI